MPCSAGGEAEQGCVLGLVMRRGGARRCARHSCLRARPLLPLSPRLPLSTPCMPTSSGSAAAALWQQRQQQRRSSHSSRPHLLLGHGPHAHEPQVVAVHVGDGNLQGLAVACRAAHTGRGQQQRGGGGRARRERRAGLGVRNAAAEARAVGWATSWRAAQAPEACVRQAAATLRHRTALQPPSGQPRCCAPLRFWISEMGTSHLAL